MIPPLVNGVLPLGRWPATLAEVRALGELPDSAHRTQLLSEWDRLTLAIGDAVGGVAACWLSGSFFTDKVDPSDIDCAYLVRHEKLIEAQKDPERAAFLQSVLAKGARDRFRLRVDTYIIDWWPRPGTRKGCDVRRRDYLAERGYWDDLWSRQRDRDLKLDRLPRRGYLEVILDGYR